MARLTRCDECGYTEDHKGYHFPQDDRWLTLETENDDDNGMLCSWTCLSAYATSRALEREAPTIPDQPS